MDSEDEFDMQDAAAESADDDFYSGGDDVFDSDDADVADYEFIDNDSDDSDDLISHRYQVLFLRFCLFIFTFIFFCQPKFSYFCFRVGLICCAYLFIYL